MQAASLIQFVCNARGATDDFCSFFWIAKNFISEGNTFSRRSLCSISMN